ncbi:MAG: hypothetical protein DDT32_01115 [Syntrophomonadaceae bacterium]|nr:hypothetical protein [Bacillota bacterium]
MSLKEAEKHPPSVKGQAFFIRIKFRQNNCWQGSIQWLEGQKTQSFSSLLELILLINEALEKADATEDKPLPRSWEQRS